MENVGSLEEIWISRQATNVCTKRVVNCVNCNMRSHRVFRGCVTILRKLYFSEEHVQIVI
jgi:hypothetical protein